MARPLTQDSAEFKAFVAVGCEDGVFYVVESNIPGLNVEAASYEELVAIATDLATHLLGTSEPPAIAFRRSAQQV